MTFIQSKIQKVKLEGLVGRGNKLNKISFELNFL